jgi:hypothetical protein
VGKGGQQGERGNFAAYYNALIQVTHLKVGLAYRRRHWVHLAFLHFQLASIESEQAADKILQARFGFSGP